MSRAHYLAETYGGDARTTVCLGAFVAPTRRLALRWLRRRARRFADALDPDPSTPWIPPLALQRVTHAEHDAPAELRAWAEDGRVQEAALRRLTEGLPYEFVIHDDAGWYAFRARPLAVLSRTSSPALSRSSV
ncbi:hypothetical protein [Streptomyces sp. JJ38]|uniref:hypothetical protein n=1 Tax=Streptomyces sp. JJ38 TaxID=2738128 RepID=UPI001C5731B5|nr:hypothetical protein [Streptomyces sp. JJ38]MBW1600246.1 hypothetical protein [Streptomyces sp. JJ38]